jgi:long-chain acyl-CoA synthetase
MAHAQPRFLDRPVTSIPAFIAESAARWVDQPALWRWVDARFEPVSYGSLVSAAACLAGRLLQHGAAPGQRVAIRHGDRFAFGVTYLATLWTGATAVPLDPMLTPVEVSGILADSEAALFVTDSLTAYNVSPAIKTRAVELADIWPNFAADDVSVANPPDIDPEALAILIFTSGTTGYSKGVMLTHANVVTDIIAIQEMKLLEHTDKLLSVLPIHHAFESTAGFLYPLSIGAQVAYARSLKSNEILGDLRSTGATVILAVPLLYEKMASSMQKNVSEASPMRRALFGVLSLLARVGHKIGWKTSGQTLFRSARTKAGLGSLRFLVSGGAALPPDVSEFFDVFGIPILQGYGLSEASPVVSVNRPGHHRYDSVGPALPGVEVRVDASGPDGIGEIAVRGPMVMRGYWKRPEDTAAVLKDGWLLTGDLGSINPDGHVHVVGRSKNVIISGAGKNIYPEEIESVLNAQPGVGESMVYGRTREGKTGEAVAAIIVPDREWFSAVQPEALRDREILVAAIKQAVKTACVHMAPYKRIVGWELRHDPFEKTSTRKIKRAVALQQLEAARG